jgi:hypothetical protein
MTELARTRPETFFSDRFSVTSGLMERVLGGNLLGKVDDADIYLEYRINEELVLEEGIVKKASRHVSQGAGVRAQAGTRTGYAHTDEISVKNLEEAARQARAIAEVRATDFGALLLDRLCPVLERAAPSPSAGRCRAAYRPPRSSNRARSTR